MVYLFLLLFKRSLCFFVFFIRRLVALSCISRWCLCNFFSASLCSLICFSFFFRSSFCCCFLLLGFSCAARSDENNAIGILVSYMILENLFKIFCIYFIKYANKNIRISLQNQFL